MDNKRRITAAFTGHRIIRTGDGERLEQDLYNLLEDLIIRRGYKYFGNGGALGFDLLAADVVLRLREKYPQIKLIMVLPYPDQTGKWMDTKEVDKYNKILRKADKISIVSQSYIKNCYALRNKKLVSNSSLLISYCYNPKSGTGQTVRMGEEEGLEIINLAE